LDRRQVILNLSKVGIKTLHLVLDLEAVFLHLLKRFFSLLRSLGPTLSPRTYVFGLLEGVSVFWLQPGQLVGELVALPASLYKAVLNGLERALRVSFEQTP
jgi:hypothetical protein